MLLATYTTDDPAKMPCHSLSVSIKLILSQPFHLII